MWAAVLAGGLGWSASADAATTCSGTLSHTTVALLDVPAGSTCVLQAVTVSSAASVEGTLDASSGGASHINGGLTINGGSARFIGGSIGGAVKIENTPAGSVTDLEAGQGVGLSIGGSVEITGNAGSVRLANLSSGSVIISGNSGHVTLVGDHVGGPLSAKNNSGGVTLSGNTVSGALTCSGNSPQPSDAGTANSTGGAGLGQCAPTGSPGDQHAIDHSYQVTENQTLVVPAPGVLAGSSDGAGHPLAAVLVSGPAHGTLTLNADGSFTYTPNPGFNGSDSFTYTANDGLAASNTATATIQVNGPPVAVDDSYDVLENGALAVVAPGVLGNDTDPSGLPLSAVLGTGPSHGTLTLNSDGSFTYTPTAGFHGTDSFTYTAHDSFLGSNVATVTIHVRAPPVAANDSYDVNEGATLNVAAPGVLGNDTDPEGLAITAVLGAGPAHGALTLNANGSFTYTPAAGFSGTDSFTYTAHDVFQGSNTATVTIHVHAPPVAVNDSYDVNAGATLTVAAPGVLGNDSDPGGLPLTAVLGSGPSHGTLTFNANGSFTYAASAGFNGTDSFTYTAHDAFQGSNVATVTIHVHGAPVAVNDSYDVNEGATLSVAAPGVLGNDSDPGGLALTAVLGTGPAHGTLTSNSDGSFTYTPTPGFSGTDSFTYTAHDAFLGSNVATVTIHVHAPPVAANDSYDVNENGALAVVAPGVLGNDSDPGGLALTAVLGAGPSHGTLTFNSNGSFSYTPAAGFSGTDSFTYTAHDAFQGSNVATVTIHVHAPPVAVNDSYDVNEGATLSVPAPGVLGNDSDPGGLALSAVLGAGPSHGTLTFNSNGSFSYTPTPGFSGTDSFTYTAHDAFQGSNVATVTIHVHAPPVAVNDSYDVNEGATLSVPAPGVLGNDSDPGGLALSAVLGAGPSHGTLTFNSNGSFTYTPTPGFSGTDSFTYTAHDAFQGSNVATVTIHVHAPPVAANDSYDVNEGATLSVAAPGVLGNDSDPGGLPLTAVLGAGPSHGTLTFNADGSFTYTPTPGFSGTDSFTYTAHDAFQGSNVATVTIHVHAPPVAVVDSYNVTEGATLTVAAPGVLGNDSDPGGLPLTAVLGAGPSHGTLTFNADGSFTYRPTPGFSGTDSFTYTAHDAFQGSNVATVTIHVNAPPVVTSTVPAGGATERPLSQAVTVNFNESVDATAGAFKLECPAGTAKAFTSSPTLPASGSVFVLVPSGPLPAGTTCTVTVVASHVSATGSGVPMAADFVFSFTTGATPVVTSTTPASGATNVPLGQAVTVTFNEPVKASAGSFALECPSGTPVAFTVPTTSPSSAYQIVPSAALPQGTVCTVTVKASGVTSVDPGDVPLAANDVFSFTTGVAPIVSATAPSNGAANQALSPAISVTFNEPVNVTSASAFSLACPSATAEPITVTPTPLNGNTTFTLTPSSPLPQGTTCTVTVNHADVSGAAAGIPMAADFTASFTTGSQPTVSSTTPVNGATGVSPSGAVTISFFENVAVSSSSAFDIECPTGTPEPFTLSPAAPGNASLFTLTPTGPLPANTVCTVTVVASDVASTPPSSIPMAANYVFSFTTASQPQAVADSYSSIGNVGITVPAAGGVLANDTLNGNSISAFDATSAHGGTVSMTTSGAGAGGFTYDPPVGFSGSDSFNYTLGTGGNTSSAKVTITDSAPVWFIDSSTTAPGDDGRLSSPFKSIADFDAVNDGGAGQPAAGQAIFVYKGSGYTSGLTLLANQVVVGQGASASLVSIAGLTVPTFSNALPSTAPASAPSITTSAGAGITLNSGNTIRGVHVGATAGPGVSGSSPGALTLGSAGPSSDVTVANTTAGADGVDLSGSGNWTVGASISATGGFSLKVSGASGTDGFSGPVSGSGQGVSLTGDAGAVNFTGGVSLSTGANPAFTATGGGTVSVACPTAGDTTCAGNTLTSTTATALNVSGTTIGGAGVTFRSISAGPFTAPPVAGGAQGIVLSGTGAGPFAVTGSGSAGSGGTISKVESTSVSAAEVSLTNTGPVSLNEMTITGDPSTANDDESGIFATNTNGLTVTNSSVTNSVGPQIFLQYTAGSTLTGSFDIAGNNVGYQGSRSSGSGIQLEFHGSGTVTGHVHGNIEGDAANANTSEFASDGGEGIDVTSDGGGTVTADISNNTVDRVLSSYGIDLQAGGNTAGGTLNATVASNTIHMDQATSADGITIVSGTNTANHATVCLNMNGNTSAAAGTAASNEQFPFDGAGVSLVQNGQTGDSTFAIQGYTGGATDLAAVQTFEINANTLSGVSDPDDEAVALIQNSAANGFTNATCPTAP